MINNNPWPDRPQRLVICIGAQKAATSFVFDQLVSDPRVLTTPRKEVHFWCSVAGSINKVWLNRSKSQYKKARVMLPLNFLRQGSESVSKLREAKQMVTIRKGGSEAWGAYKDILSPKNQQQTVAFEATPSYALLPTETYRQMAAFHPNLSILYILRDPIKRLWSAIAYSMRHEIAKGTKSEEDIGLAFRHALDKLDGNFQHSNFPDTLDRLNHAGLQDQVSVMFMETMSEDNELKTLGNVLGFQPKLNFKKMVNKNPHKSKLPPEQLEYGVDIMKPIYSEMRNRFGDRVPKSWLG